MHYFRHLTCVCFIFLCQFSLANAKEITYETIPNGYFTSIHVLTVDPNEHEIVPVKAMGDKVSRETVSTMANRYGAIAAVNGGFWKPDGTPSGALKINKWLSTPVKQRGAVGWSLHHNNAMMDRILTSCSVKDCPDGKPIKVLPARTSPAEWNKFDYIVGGTPLLIQNGKPVRNVKTEQTLESFIVKRHPRTAVGIKENGDWVFVVVDSRFYGVFGGMTIKELAKFMLDLGCVEALNLDGGGSSTMVLHDEVVSQSSGSIYENGQYVEAVSDAIIIL